MRTTFPLLFGAVLGFSFSCSTSPSSITDTRPSDPPSASTCPSCPSAPTSSASIPGSVTNSAPACSAWSAPSAVVADYNQCSRLPEQDSACKTECETRGIAWSCPAGLAYSMSCFQQGEHWCCADVWCRLILDNKESWCDGNDLIAYDCWQQIAEYGPGNLPDDMGCKVDNQESLIRCCPFTVMSVNASSP